MDHQLLELAKFENDPLAFVGYSFPWGEPQTALEKYAGPEEWQKRVLVHIRDRLLAGLTRKEAINEAIRTAVASGHGVGKSALVSWIVLWSLATMVDTRGVVTANTETQLKTKTWAELGKWFNLFVARQYFDLTATAIFFKGRERTWRIDMVPWTIQKTEAFAGLHNQGKRVLLVMDEASAIDDKIWEVAEGALTDADTQILWCVFGNPTRNIGRFKDCFERYRDRWWREQVDSRSVSFTNKPQIEAWQKDYGDDSDWFRIRIRGVFPRTGEMEFISAAEVEEAMSRDFVIMRTDPLIIGVDVARYGANESVIFFRKGRDARSIAPIRLRGVSTVDLARKVLEAYQQYHADAIFVDGGGVGGGVVDNIRSLHLHCYDIQFGGKSEGIGFTQGVGGELYANKRAEMWGLMRAWMKGGALPDIPDLRTQLIGPTYTFNLRNEIQLEKKEDMMKRGIESPDIADALALTFALPVANHEFAGGDHPQKPLVESEYNPFDAERMVA